MSKNSGRPNGPQDPENCETVGKYMIHAPKFFSRIIKDSNDCHIWNGGKHRQGYGMFNLYNTELGKKQMNVTHRIAMMLHLGRELGRDEFVVHEFCDNQLCCNPAHMIVGTAKDRNRVQYAKGRFPTKFKTGNAVKKQNRNYKWTDDQMRYIRDHSHKEIAQHFNVSERAASNMKYRIKGGYKWL